MGNCEMRLASDSKLGTSSHKIYSNYNNTPQNYLKSYRRMASSTSFAKSALTSVAQQGLSALSEVNIPMVNPTTNKQKLGLIWLERK